MRQQKRSLVVALGNPLAGDDGFGAAVLQRLRQDPDLIRVAELRDAHTDLLRILDEFGRYDQVILVDTALGAGRSGEVIACGEPSFIDWPETSPSCHQMSPLLTVLLFRRLYPEARTRISLVALCTEEIRLAPVPPDKLAVEAGAEWVRRLVGTPSPDPLPSPGSPKEENHS